MSKKTNKDVDLEKLNREWTMEHGIDLEARTIRVTGVIGSPDPLMGEEEYFDFNLCDIALTKLERLSTTEPITIKINSMGGSVYEALAIIGRIKSSPCHIITEGYGAVMSAATLILMCGAHRRLSKYAVCMFHKIQYGVDGDHDSIEDQVSQSKKEVKQWAQIYEDTSNKPLRFWLNKMRKKEFYPTPEEMLSYEAIDELI